VQLAAAVMQGADQSLPKVCGNWADLKAAYRLLSNPRVDPQAIGRPHRRQTFAACAGAAVVLSIEDTTELDLTTKAAMRGRGRLGGGSTRGLLQHSALAVIPAPDEATLETPAAQVLGLLHQQWNRRTDPPAGETLRQLQARRTDGDVWLETARGVAGLGVFPVRLIHVADRGGDIFRHLQEVGQLGHGFVVRARYDRALQGDALSEEELPPTLWASLRAQPVAGTRRLKVHEQRTVKGVVRWAAREVTVAVRYRAVTLTPPRNDPRTAGAAPLACYAVLVEEQGGDGAAPPLQWLLLTSELVTTVAEAWRIVHYYRHRWIIEEWHRALKEGCRVEEASFDDALDVQRLAAIKGIIAVRLLQLRELAQKAGSEPAALQQAVPRTWVRVVAALAKVPAPTLTPRQFWLTIAQQGGYLARRRDPRPGWKVLWRGWSDIQHMVRGVEAVEGSCG
jgi:hypothetical protein